MAPVFRHQSALNFAWSLGRLSVPIRPFLTAGDVQLGKMAVN